MSEDFGVGLRFEDMAGVDQPPFQFQVILDDPVVDDGDALLTVDMGMGVLVGWTAVGCPAGVAQAYRTGGVGPGAVKAVDLANGLA